MHISNIFICFVHINRDSNPIFMDNSNKNNKTLKQLGEEMALDLIAADYARGLEYDNLYQIHALRLNISEKYCRALFPLKRIREHIRSHYQPQHQHNGKARAKQTA